MSSQQSERGTAAVCGANIGVLRLNCANEPPAYPFTRFDATEDAIFYAFASISTLKTIQKVVIFTPADQGTYNLALLDLLDSGELSDTVVSDNEDMEQILATVIQIVLHFLHDNPTVSVSFKGSTPGRTRLYRAVIGKFLGEITNLCVVQGFTQEGQLEPFRANQNYTAFVVSLL